MSEPKNPAGATLPPANERAAPPAEIVHPSSPVTARRSGGASANLKKLFVMREENLFLLLAVIIGLFSGLAVVCFRIAIDYTRLWLLGSSLIPPPARVLLMPTLGGIVVAFIVVQLFQRVRGSGVNQTKAAVYIYDGYIPFRTVVGKFITCALAIGSGHSLGPEDPSLQMGAGIASALGRRLKLSREKVRLIAPVGAAAGLAAAFNAPISAVLFVIEEVIGNWSAGVLGAIVLSAVSSVVVLRTFLGQEPLFQVPAQVYRLVHPAELVAYAVLGVMGGLSSLLFVKLIAELRPRLKALPRWTLYVQPAVAGLLIGVIGLWLPQVLGAGYEVINQAIHDQYSWRMLALLGIFKLLATTFSFVSGTPGGMFAPTLFIGGMIGGAVGGVEHLLYPRLTTSVAAYALVGMGTLFAGFLRAPMTSVFMVLEVSGDYSIILPVMIANTISYLLARRFQSTALFDLLSRQDGVELPSMEELREESLLRVEDAMRRPAPVLKSSETVAQALAQLGESTEDHFLVSFDNGAWSWIAKDALRRKADAGEDSLVVGKILADRRVPPLHPDQPIHQALAQMGDWPLLPVVHRADFRKLEGVISLKDIMAALQRNSAALNFIKAED